MSRRRVSEREAFLERENEYLRKRLDRLQNNPPEIPFCACDNSCIVAQPEGMATNGGCRCDGHKLHMAVRYWRQVAVHRLSIIEMLRPELSTLDGKLVIANNRIYELESKDRAEP